MLTLGHTGAVLDTHGVTVPPPGGQRPDSRRCITRSSAWA
jgi:hypothetical protein